MGPSDQIRTEKGFFGNKSVIGLLLSEHRFS